MTTYDMIINGGRVMDPESGEDRIANVGVSNGTIQAITKDTLLGKDTINAKGLVVAPGVIDLHSHGQDGPNYRIQARDGVTTALELELGALDIDSWYGERKGQALINFGASVGHIPTRIHVMRDPSNFIPVADAAYKTASEEQIQEMKALLDKGLRRGALAVGLALEYTPAASRWEVLEMFRIAAQYSVSCHVHMRGVGRVEPASSIEGLAELIAASVTTGAPIHVVHISSSGLRATPHLLQMIEEARANGLDITTECYPYETASTTIDGAALSEGWQEKKEIDYGDLEWALTGERLTASTFAEYREIGGKVFLHSIPPEIVEEAVASPLTMIATDGAVREGTGHPRTAGTYSRVLGRFVRDSGSLTIMDALRKFSLMPAQRLEARVPGFRKKGRVSVGADADLMLFDPDRVIDRATFREPALPPEGIPYVIVNGTPVVQNGTIVEDVWPGQEIRSSS